MTPPRDEQTPEASSIVIRGRTFTWSAPTLMQEAGQRMSGLDLMRGPRDGFVPSAPIAALVGLSLTEVDAGRIVMCLTPAEYRYNPIGDVLRNRGHGVIRATLLDSVMGRAVHSTLPQGQEYTSLETEVNDARAVTNASGTLSATGVVGQAGRRSAVAEGKVTDAKGRLCATASMTCLVFDQTPS